MSEAIEETSAVKAARAIGAASKNKDWQFAAKHWPRMADDDEHKRELLKLGEAASREAASEIYSGYSKYAKQGEWYQTGTMHGQITSVSFDGTMIHMLWYKDKNWMRPYTTGSYGAQEVKNWTKLDKRPF